MGVGRGLRGRQGRLVDGWEELWEEDRGEGAVLGCGGTMVMEREGGRGEEGLGLLGDLQRRGVKGEGKGR